MLQTCFNYWVKTSVNEPIWVYRPPLGSKACYSVCHSVPAAHLARYLDAPAVSSQALLCCLGVKKEDMVCRIVTVAVCRMGKNSIQDPEKSKNARFFDQIEELQNSSCQ